MELMSKEQMDLNVGAFAAYAWVVAENGVPAAASAA